MICKNCGHRIKKGKWKPTKEKCKGCFSFGRCTGYEHSKADSPNEHPQFTWCAVKTGKNVEDYCGCSNPEPKEAKKRK